MCLEQGEMGKQSFGVGPVEIDEPKIGYKSSIAIHSQPTTGAWWRDSQAFEFVRPLAIATLEKQHLGHESRKDEGGVGA